MSLLGIACAPEDGGGGGFPPRSDRDLLDESVVFGCIDDSFCELSQNGSSMDYRCLDQGPDLVNRHFLGCCRQDQGPDLVSGRHNQEPGLVVVLGCQQGNHYLDHAVVVEKVHLETTMADRVDPDHQAGTDW